jgi:hypothetical protein
VTPGGLRLLVVPVLAASLLAPGPGALSAQEVTYQGSLQYATGSYVFTQRTQTFWLSNGFSVRSGRLGISASVPIVLQDNDVVSSVGGVMSPTGGAGDGLTGQREGDAQLPTAPHHGGRGMMTSPEGMLGGYQLALGDPLVNTSLEVYRGTRTLRSVAAGAGAKAPIARRASGVGTGEWDYSLGASLTAGIGAQLLMADVSYWWLGDLPELELRDAVSYGLGVGAPLGGGRWAGLLSLSGSSRVIETLDAPASLSAGLLHLPRTGPAFSGGFAIGLTDAAPSFGMYLGWRSRLR